MKKKILLNDKIFIAGSSGMVGSAIHRKLLQAGYSNMLCPSSKELNLLQSEKVLKWFECNKPDIVILAAARVGGIMANFKNPTEFLLENLKIQNNVIETAWKFNVKRFLFLGSSCIYPKYAKQPLKEEYLLTGALEKTNESYAIAKIAGIKLCESLRRQYKFDAISLMPTNLYGPKDNYDLDQSHVMAALIRKFCYAKKYSEKKVCCWGSGSPFREFLHVDDLGDAVRFVIENWDPDGINAPKDNLNSPIYLLNVGSGQDISIKELAEKISRICKFEGEIHWDKSKPDGTPKKLLDISAIKNLGWKPKIPLDEGIKSTITEFQKHI